MSRGSGTRLANTTARQTGNDLRAHHRCSVEMCPWRIDLSRTLSADTSLMGMATSMGFLGWRMSDVVNEFLFNYFKSSVLVIHLFRTDQGENIT